MKGVDPERVGALQDGSIVRQVARLATPVLIEQALLYLVGLSDTILTGRFLAVEDLAAVTVCSYLIWSLGGLMMVVSAGSTALVARMIGGGDKPAATHIVRQSISLGLLVGAGLMIIGIYTAPWVIRLMRLDGRAALVATEYFRIVLLSTPFLAVQVVGVASLRGAGDTRTGMWVMVIVNSVNTALSWLLVVGAFGLPRLALAGVAVGTSAGYILGGLIILSILLRGRAGLSLGGSGFIPQIASTLRILRISLPAAGESLTNSLCQLWFLGVINGLGEAATAAHGVAIRCEAIAFLTVTAFAVAASTLAGQYLGAGRPDLARRSAILCWMAALGTLTALGAVIFLLARTMFLAFLGDEQAGVAEIGVPVLRLVTFALPALATINVLTGTLRGAGDTRWPWLFVVLGYLVVRLPLTYWFILPATSGGLDLGLYGAWIAMSADLYTRATLVAGRFLQDGWSNVDI